MENIFIVITAQVLIPAKGAGIPVDLTAGNPGGENKGAKSDVYGDDFCALFTGVIGRICRDLAVIILKSECFEKEGRMALVVRADATNAAGGLANLRNALDIAGKKLNTAIRVQKEDLFRYMHRI